MLSDTEQSIACIAVQEHTTTDEGMASLKRLARTQKCRIDASPLDPFAAKPAAGVATLASDITRMARIEPTTSSLQEMRHQGRAEYTLIHTAMGFPLRIFNIYGWAGSSESAVRRAKTEGLMQAVFEE
eukprot:10951578-Alexandrium_andersonii.AAC.1